MTKKVIKYFPILLLLLNISCVPSNFKKLVVKDGNIEGVYKIDRSDDFMYALKEKYSRDLIFNTVKIKKVKGSYSLTLYQNEKLLKSYNLNLRLTKSGAFKHPTNKHFRTYVLLSYIGGYNTYFGLNKSNNLVTKISQGGMTFILVIPFFPAVGINKTNEWLRISKNDI